MPSAPPAETIVYLSRWKVPLWIGWFSVLSVGAVVLILRKPPPPLLFSLSGLKPLAGYAFGWLMAVVFAGYAIRYAVQLLRHQPVFRLGVLGIQLGTDPLDPWRDIQNEKVVVIDGRQRKVLLSYLTQRINRQLEVSDCGITAGRLQELLVHYRQQALYETRPGT